LEDICLESMHKINNFAIKLEILGLHMTRGITPETNPRSVLNAVTRFDVDLFFKFFEIITPKTQF